MDATFSLNFFSFCRILGRSFSADFFRFVCLAAYSFKTCVIASASLALKKTVYFAGLSDLSFTMAKSTPYLFASFLKSFIPESVKESLNKDYFFNEHYFGKMVDSFLESLGLKSINEINSEKKASEYISYIVDEVSNIDEAYMYDEKSNRAFNMLCSIPYMSLSINLSEAFIESQIVNQINMVK